MTSSIPDLRDRSENLHQQVRAYVARGQFREAEFVALAEQIANFQADACPQYARLRSDSNLAPLPGVAPLPADAFRFARVFAFDESEAEACFVTSGTTGSESGKHRLRTLETYRSVALDWGKRALLSDAKRRVVAALMPQPNGRSSLATMAGWFMHEFDGAALNEGRAPGFSVSDSLRWLLSGEGIDLNGLRSVVGLAEYVQEPVLLLTTSFALVMLLDALGSETLPLPPGSVVMTTGGFKGRTREVSRSELYEACQRLLRPAAVVGEYGMTELSSQLYEGLVPGAELQGPDGIYLEPPSLRVYPLDPITLSPVNAGQPGLACFVDLANVDSAVCVLTQDLVVREAGGIRLLGRAPRAPLRGCSLAAESLSLPPPSAKSLAPTAQSKAAAGGSLEPVRRLISAARILADAETPAGRRLRSRLLECTGLSPQGVELGLTQALETEASDEQLVALCGAAPEASRVWVQLSANVFVAALRAIAVAVASGAEVLVRPSRRDPALAEALSELLFPDAPFRLVDEVCPQPGDHVYAYGSDQTMAALRESLPAGCVLHPHGAGFGAVAVYPGADLSATARGIAADVVLFDQQGCLSPRVVFVDSGCDAAALTDALATALRQLSEEVPVGSALLELAGQQRWFELVAAYVGEFHPAGPGGLVVQESPDAVLLPPASRNLCVCVVPDPAQALLELGDSLTCVSVAGDAQTSQRTLALLPHVRHSAVGQMQRPALDGPVDRRPGTAAVCL